MGRLHREQRLPEETTASPPTEGMPRAPGFTTADAPQLGHTARMPGLGIGSSIPYVAAHFTQSSLSMR
jgi:hypothetical protein